MKEATFEYKARDQFQPFHRRRQKWAIIVARRRAGKRVATINYLIDLAQIVCCEKIADQS
jgi:hypothetical protein